MEKENVQKQILEAIDKADRIILYRHIYPDWDATGSQMGLYEWIRGNYPEKEVYLAGNHSRFPMDEIPSDLARGALAIVLDTSTKERIDGENFEHAANSVRIDHHVLVEPVADLEWIETPASATCEMLAELFEKSGKPLPAKAAQYLYQGLIADNVGFSISSVSPQTFQRAAYLLSQGADVIQAQMEIFGNDFDSFAFDNRVRSLACRRDNFLYSVVNAQDYLSRGFSYARAKEKVYLLSGFRQIETWALFTMKEDGTTYTASLRSRTIPIRDIAEKFGGGGHACAAGIKSLSLEQLWQVIELMSERSLQNPETEMNKN